MQNLHKDPLLMNLLVSDPFWFKLFQDIMAYRSLKAIYGADYSQIEVRVLAHMSQDKLLISQFQSGLDIHASVGHELTGWSVKRLSKPQNHEDETLRKLIKNMHFGIIFGLGEDSLPDYLRAKGVKNVSDERVKELHRGYFKKYRGVRDFQQAMQERGERLGYVETMFGFRREVGGADRDTYWGNQSINSPIQGSAHQLVLMAMAMLHKRPITYALLQEMTMEVHDALYFFTPVKDLPEVHPLCMSLMTEEVPRQVKRLFGFELTVPLKAEAKAGFRLGSMVDYDGEAPKEFVERWLEKNTKVEAGVLAKYDPKNKYGLLSRPV